MSFYAFLKIHDFFFGWFLFVCFPFYCFLILLKHFEPLHPLFSNSKKVDVKVNFGHFVGSILKKTSNNVWIFFSPG